MAANGSQEKVDVLVYGPSKPVIDGGFPANFVLHKFENQRDLGRLAPDVAARIRGIAVTGLVQADAAMLAKFPKTEIVSSFGVGYDHIDSKYAAGHNIIVCNTPDVLTEEVADTALGLLIATVREFIKADRYLRAGHWTTQSFPLSPGSLRDRKVGMVGMGRIGQAIARRLDASLVPVVYHSRNPAKDVTHKHYPNLIEMAKEVDTLIAITPGGPSTLKMINAEVLKALGPRGVLINVARGSVVDEEALIAALKDGRLGMAALDVFETEPTPAGRWEGVPNTVLTPHMAGGTLESIPLMVGQTIENLRRFFGDEPLASPVRG
jgi:lactate dehydrogenase-like 2-hydroxyacid dehydrogenase